MDKPKITRPDSPNPSSPKGGEGTRGGKYPVVKPGGKFPIVKPSKPNKS